MRQQLTVVRPDGAVRFLLTHKISRRCVRPANNLQRRRKNLRIRRSFDGVILLAGTIAMARLDGLNFRTWPSAKKLRNCAEERFLSLACEEARNRVGRHDEEDS